MNMVALFVCKAIIVFVFACVMYVMIDAYISGKPVDVSRYHTHHR